MFITNEKIFEKFFTIDANINKLKFVENMDENEKKKLFEI